MHIAIFDLKLVYKVNWDEDDNTTLFALVVFEACLSLIFFPVCCAAAARAVNCILSESSLSGLN
jgi:metal-sulfur cluster biosynthetic enzyme